MRRLRRNESLRALVRETAVTPGDMIYPLFLCPGQGVRRPISSMPGVFNLSIDEAVREAEEAAQLGLGGLRRGDDRRDERPAAVGVNVGRDAVGRAHLGYAGQFL